MAPTSTRPATAAKVAIRRSPGRPRRPGIEDAVLGATIELLSERGIEGTTTNAIVERSGVARATVYLRWPNHQALITAAVRQAMGRPVLAGTGDVERDLRAGAARIQEIFASPAFRSVFPAVVAGLTQGDTTASAMSYDAIAPGRAVMAQVYREFAASQGFRDDISPDLVVDLLTGAHIGHYLATGTPPDEAVSRKIVDVVFDGLRARPSAAAQTPASKSAPKS